MTNNSDTEEDYLKGYGMALVTLRNRIAELEEREAALETTIMDISHNVDAATYLLKTFMEAQGYKGPEDT